MASDIDKILMTFSLPEKSVYEDMKDVLSSIESLPESKKRAFLNIINEHYFLSMKVEQQRIACTKLQKISFGNQSESFLFDYPEKASENEIDPIIEDKNEHEEEYNENKTKKKRSSGKIKLSELKNAEKVLVTPNDIKECPSCHKETLNQGYTEKQTLVLAMPLLKVKVFHMPSLRCSCCQHVEKSAIPEELNPQNKIGRYHHSAVSILASFRYQFGMPAYRFEFLSAQVGARIPDATQWDLMEHAAKKLRHFYQYLKDYSAHQAQVLHADDSPFLIVDLRKDLKKQKENAILNGQKTNGITIATRTTNVTALFPEGKIVLYFFGSEHAGNRLSVFCNQRTNSEKVVIMTDALSSNTKNVDENKAEFSLCNVHARRNFYDLREHNTEKVDKILILYRDIFLNDRKSKKKRHNPTERLLFHKTHSLLLMEKILHICQSELNEKSVEPNSTLAKAYKYIIRHFKKLCAFCELKNAPLENNLSERMLKIAIRYRRNSLFFKNQNGADVGAIITSILATAYVNEINSIEYLTNLLNNSKTIMKNPEKWLPWNYKNNSAITTDSNSTPANLPSAN